MRQDIESVKEKIMPLIQNGGIKPKVAVKLLRAQSNKEMKRIIRKQEKRINK